MLPDSIITEPQFTIILAVLFARFKDATYSFPFIGITFNLAGTFLHEMTHFIAALLFGAKPSSFSLWPQRTSSGWILGHVEVTNAAWYNHLPVGMAPLSLFVAAYYAKTWYLAVPDHTLWSDLLYLAGLVILIENAIPSWQDVKMATKSWVGIIAYSVILAFIVEKLNQ